jgi:hypothetical protein
MMSCSRCVPMRSFYLFNLMQLLINLVSSWFHL